ncbi:MAG: gerAA 1 [Firmicutes bacterium]|nr:gerAA 1 [Bacillota bacterium]
MNIFQKNFKAIKKLVIFQPPQTPSQFVLTEMESPCNETPNQLDIALSQHKATVRYAKRVTSVLEKAETLLSEPYQVEKIQAFKVELDILQEQQKALSPLVETYNLSQNPLDQSISTSLEENILLLKHLYNWPQNKDLILRSITIPAKPLMNAKLAFIDGLVDSNTISQTVINPLMLAKKDDLNLYTNDFLERLITQYLPGSQAILVDTLRAVTDGLNLGNTAIFFDHVAKAMLIETKGQEHRSIDRPVMEQTARGSQSAFTETLRVNTGLVRSILRTNDLTTELLTLGTRSNTLCAIMYLKPIINPALVQEARRRLSNLNVDTISDSGALQRFIEDHPSLPFPQTLSTERPDRVAAAISEGRLAILLDGSPFVVVAPINFFTLYHSAEDFSYSWLAGSFSRIVRFLGSIIATILPAFYIAISYFHQEALPTDLILAIGTARERVPFPSFLEILAMEFSFELLREGGIRVPGMLGSTISIVGAIILGQTAVAASIVSPITVVIIAITGLASFSIPDYSMAFSLRLVRFAFELLAALLGLVGIASGLIALAVLLCSMKSLGAPYMAPVGPKTTPGFDTIVRGPVFSQERRPDELNPQDKRKQANISRQWTKEPPAQEENEP